MVVTLNGRHAISDVALVRQALIDVGFTATKPSDEWIRYYLRQSLSVSAIVEIAYGRPLTSRLES